MVAGAALLPIPWLIGPACPDQIIIAAGQPGGSYYACAQQYQQLLKAHGIDVKIKSTNGSVENLQRLSADQPQIDLAFIQGGMCGKERHPQLRSLASLYYEPVWIFFRTNSQDADTAEAPPQDLGDLAGKRIAIGRKGSGTRQLALSLLSLNNIEPGGVTELAELGVNQAADAVRNGEVDAAFFVMSPEAGLIKELLQNDQVKPLSLRRVKTYAAHHQYLSTVALPEGYVDLETNVPDTEINLLAPTANLVATDNLHPALVPLLLEVASRIHEPSGCFNQFGQFPNLRSVDFAANEDARRFFRSGPNPLFRWLPFHWAAWLDRVKLLLLPMCTLLLPLAKIAPPVYRRQIRCKIYRWYKVLRQIDLELDTVGDSVTCKDNLQHLDQLEKELADISVPLSYMEEFYNLRLHVEHVRKRLQASATPGLKLRKTDQHVGGDQNQGTVTDQSAA